jgi:hypothetical protein
VALALGIPLFGWIDLTATWGLDEDTTTWDLAYGGLTGIILPVAFVLSAPVMAVAGAGGYAVAGLAGGQLRYLVLAAAVALAAGLLLGRPRGSVQVEPALAALAVAATPALVWLAVHASRHERSRTTGEAHAGFHAWAGVAAFAVGAMLVSWSAAIGAHTRPAALSVGAAVGYYGLGCVVYPDAAASVGRFWGSVAIAWAIAFVAAAMTTGIPGHRAAA